MCSACVETFAETSGHDSSDLYSPLEAMDNKIRIVYPTALAPRYATASGTDPLDAAIDGDALNPPHVLSVPYGLNFSEAEIHRIET